jgi:hypothetical protein
VGNIENSQILYTSLISRISDILETYSYIKKGETFYYYDSNNWGLVNFQKEKSISSTGLSFTINLGICSNSLRVFFGRDTNKKPKIEECHWRKRIGLLLKNKKDYWWIIKNDSSIESIIKEIKTVLVEQALTEIKKYISDEDLEKYWLSGVASGITEFERYMYLTILMKNNNRDDLGKVINDFIKFSKGKSFEYSSKIHLAELGFKYE